MPKVTAIQEACDETRRRGTFFLRMPTMAHAISVAARIRTTEHDIVTRITRVNGWYRVQLRTIG